MDYVNSRFIFFLAAAAAFHIRLFPSIEPIEILAELFKEREQIGKKMKFF